MVICVEKFVEIGDQLFLPNSCKHTANDCGGGGGGGVQPMVQRNKKNWNWKRNKKK